MRTVVVCASDMQTTEVPFCALLLPSASSRPNAENDAKMGQDWDEDPESLFRSQELTANTAEVSSGEVDGGESFSPELFGEDEVRWPQE